MTRKISLFLLILFAFPCLVVPGAYTQEDSPIVHFAFAQGKIRQGEVWKIYLSVSDPDGRMSRIVYNIQQAGAERYYRPSIIYLKRRMEKQFAGCLALHTNSSQNLSGEELILILSILDRPGNMRKTLRFPLEFDGDPAALPPADVGKELIRRIGIVDVDFDLTD